MTKPDHTQITQLHCVKRTLRMSVPRRKPPSPKMGTCRPTASTTCGSISTDAVHARLHRQRRIRRRQDALHTANQSMASSLDPPASNISLARPQRERKQA